MRALVSEEGHHDLAQLSPGASIEGNPREVAIEGRMHVTPPPRHTLRLQIGFVDSRLRGRHHIPLQIGLREGEKREREEEQREEEREERPQGARLLLGSRCQPGGVVA
jgi:hypothetical protein